MTGSLGLFGAYLSSTSEVIRSVFAKRSLLLALAKRDVSDDYVEHSLAKGWPIVHPLVVMSVYLFVFTYVFPSRVSGPISMNTNAPIYLMAGIIPWITTAQVMSRSLTSIVNNAVIVKQMTFPLEFLAIKTLAAPLFSAAVSLAFLVAYAVYVTGGACIAAYAVGLPLLVVMTVAFLLGVAMLFSCIQVFVRDFREFVGIVLAIGLFIHPILYLPNAIPDVVRPALFVSPFTYLLFCWQDVLFFGEVTRPIAWIIAPVLSVAMLVVGARVFVASKSHFGDFL
jgi:lipopolysaccharide transport system permease protein